MAEPLSRQSESFVNSSYSFFTLPTELRLMVYRFLMVEQDPVDVESVLYDELYMPFQGGHPRRKVLAIGAQRPRYDHQARRNLSAGLLSVHSEVLKEASPILYGANTFTARRAVLLNLFFDAIGARHTHHIKSIRIRLEDFTKGSTRPLSRWYGSETVHESGVWPHLPSLHTITLVFDHPLMFCEDLKLQTTRDALSWLNASKPANGNFMYDYMLTARLQPGAHWFIVITGWIGREEVGSGLWDDGWGSRFCTRLRPRAID